MIRTIEIRAPNGLGWAIEKKPMGYQVILQPDPWVAVII